MICLMWIKNYGILRDEEFVLILYPTEKKYIQMIAWNKSLKHASIEITWSVFISFITKGKEANGNLDCDNPANIYLVVIHHSEILEQSIEYDEKN